MAEEDGSLLPIDIQGGLVAEDDLTEYAGGPRWRETTNIRFVNSKPAKVGGWRSEVNYSFSGTPKAATNWLTLQGHSVVAVASQCRLEIVYDGDLYDITPVWAELDPMTTDPFTTTNGSSEVEVEWSAHGAAVGDRVIFDDATAVNGTTLDGEYEIIEVIDLNTFVVDAGNNANADGAGGGSVVVGQLLLPCGSSAAVAGLGYGVGPYSEGTYGTPRTAGASISLDARYWSLDFWGEDLIATVRNGLTYLWDASGGPVRAEIIDAAAPERSRFSRVSPADRHLICFGCNPDGDDQDPMLIRWCDRNDYGQWTPSAVNDAGDKRLTIGTKIMGAIRSRDAFLVGTDEALYTMQFTGAPLTYTFKMVSEATGMLGQNAGCAQMNNVFVVGKDGFFVYNGSVAKIPCLIEKHVFARLSKEHAESTFVGTNVKFDEVWYFLPLDGAENPNHVVIMNSRFEFSLFAIERVVWMDRRAQITTPYALTADGTLYYHEVGEDDDNMPMTARARSMPFEMNLPDAPNGTALCLIRQIIPDHSTTGELQMFIRTKKEPLDDSPVTKGPFICTSTTRKISVRARGRQAEIEYLSEDLGNAWKAGKPRIRVQEDGGR